MKSESIEEIKEEIITKKSKDKGKVKNLGLLAGITLTIRILLLPFEINGLVIELLWLPGLLFIFAFPFYLIDHLLGRIKKS